MFRSRPTPSRSRTRSRMLVVGLLGAVLTLTACTSGQTGSSDSASSSGEGTLVGNEKDFDAASTKALDLLKGKKVGFVPVVAALNPTAGWAKDMKEGFEALGMEFTVKDAAFDPNRFTQAVDAYINEKPDVLIVQNPDVQVTAKQLQKAQDAGIYVIQLNLQSATQTDAYIGANFQEVGRRTGEEVLASCKNEKVAVLVGNKASFADILYLRGYEKAWGDDVDLVGTYETAYGADKAREVTETLLKQHKDLCGVVSTYSGMTQGAVAARDQASSDAKIWSADASNYACEGVLDGAIEPAWGTSVQQIGMYAVATAQQLLESGKPAGSNKYLIFTPTVKIDKAGAKYPTRCFPSGN